MKRKPYDATGGEKSIYSTYPLESTLLVNTGNADSGSDCIGKIDTVRVNASISSGARLFQYNRYFWNKDIFMTNYSNCCCFVAIAYHHFIASLGQPGSYFSLYPIFLPRTALATYQSLSNGYAGSVTQDPVKRKYMIDDLLYYLNGAFTGFNYDTLPAPARETGGLALPTAGYPFQGGPSLYAANACGYLFNTDNYSEFPIFQNGSSGLEPPLKWVYSSSNNQIALIRNPGFWDSPELPVDAERDIAFQIVSPEYFFFSAPYIRYLLDNTFYGGSFTSPVSLPSTCNSTSNINGGGSHDTDTERGWCSQGAYVTGFGQSDAFSTNERVIFTDVYGTSEARQALFNQTRFPTDTSPIVQSLVEFREDAKVNLLERYLVVGKKICSLLPSRYFTVSSQVLTRDQKMMPLSNNPALSSPDLMAVEYLDLDRVRTKVDATAVNDTSIVHLNPYYSIQSLDLVMKDEYGSYLQNFRTPSGFTLTYSEDYPNPYVFGYTGNYIYAGIEGEIGFNNGIFVIPPWLAALNPNTSGGNVEPLIGPFSTYLSQAVYGIFAYRKASRVSIHDSDAPIPSDFSPNFPNAANMIHFGRVLGY